MSPLPESTSSPAESTPNTDSATPLAQGTGRRWGRVWGGAAILFGLATLHEGGTVLISEEARREVGHVVPFVLWFNVIAALGYIGAGAGLWGHRRWARTVATALACASLVVFGALGLYIALGRPFEMRTVAAMTLRSAFWIGAAVHASRRRGGTDAASR